MDFRRLPTVPRAQDLIDTAFGRASKASPPKVAPRTEAKSRELARVGTVSKTLEARLRRIVRDFPSLDQLHPFYLDLIDVLVGLDRTRKSLGAVDWCRKQVRTVCNDAMQEIRVNVDDTDRMGAIRRGAYGRVASLLKQIDKDLAFLENARRSLRDVPDVDPDTATVVIAGYPNVGKSSFLRMVTNAEPEVATYPFTTKGVAVGHVDDREGRVQLVDTPGLLDRPMDERNEIEQQAVLALRRIAHAVLFVLDPSETCGYPLSDQRALLDGVQGLFEDAPVLIVENKSEIATTGEHAAMSCQTGEGVEEIKAEVLRLARGRHKEILRAQAAEDIEQWRE